MTGRSGIQRSLWMVGDTWARVTGAKRVEAGACTGFRTVHPENEECSELCSGPGEIGREVSSVSAFRVVLVPDPNIGIDGIEHVCPVS